MKHLDKIGLFLVAILAISSWFLGGEAFGAIGFDASSNSGWKGATSTFTWSHTVTGSNTLLFCGISSVDDTRTVTGMSYNGVALTSIRTDPSAGNHRTTIFYLPNPTTGLNTVSTTLSGNPIAVFGGCMSLTGVAQTGTLDANNGGTNSTTTVTTVANNSWILDMQTNSGASGFTPAAGQTEVFDIAGSFAEVTETYKGPVTPAGATTVNEKPANPGAVSHSAASFAPVIIAVATTTPHVAITGGKTIIQGNGKVVIK